MKGEHMGVGGTSEGQHMGVGGTSEGQPMGVGCTSEGQHMGVGGTSEGQHMGVTLTLATMFTCSCHTHTRYYVHLFLSHSHSLQRSLVACECVAVTKEFEMRIDQSPIFPPAAGDDIGDVFEVSTIRREVRRARMDICVV